MTTRQQAATRHRGARAGAARRPPSKVLWAAAAWCACAAAAHAGEARPRGAAPPARQAGIASVYAGRFHGRLMADGRRYDHGADNAASKVLPLGTVARVRNLATGRSATVRIQDRGPYVAGRVIDLSARTAGQIGLTPRQGLARVVVQVVHFGAGRRPWR